MQCAGSPIDSGSAIETDEMWLQLQTDLKEAIESVWTVMGYPERCRGACCRNEMHLFVPPPPLPPLPLHREDDWAVRLLTTPALSIYWARLPLVVLQERLAA